MTTGGTHIGEEEQLHIRRLLDGVADPELPVLSVNDLGIIRQVQVTEPWRKVEILITPTYSGCPAMDVIAMNLRLALAEGGYTDVTINTTLAPAWSTDWMSEEGKEKLKAYGIAPPVKGRRGGTTLFAAPQPVACPQCGSSDTSMISEFGSTACKSLFRCNTCGEPFDHFKCH